MWHKWSEIHCWISCRQAFLDRNKWGFVAGNVCQHLAPPTCPLAGFLGIQWEVKPKSVQNRKPFCVCWQWAHRYMHHLHVMLIFFFYIYIYTNKTTHSLISWNLPVVLAPGHFWGVFWSDAHCRRSTWEWKGSCLWLESAKESVQIILSLI